ncbi:MAG TPA: hypothetical protein VHH73_03275 [Verrucomicrobiae bacterium]|nr:hypothetical protein [Verrucomicrobiae bacterium]
MKDQRSSIAPQNLQAILDAAASPKAALQTGQQQYSTPQHWAEFFCKFLPQPQPSVVFDPQCAKGNLFSGTGWYSHRFGWDIDQRFGDSKNASDRVRRLTGNCVHLWELLDELYPDVRFECQVANPPFGIRWKVPDGTEDSTLYTWRKIQERAAANGFGYFLANRDTLERLGLVNDPRVYLYQTFPAGMFEGTAVEVGVLHWHNGERPARLDLAYRTLDEGEHAAALKAIVDHYEPERRSFQPAFSEEARQLNEIWQQLSTILAEEESAQPPANLWLDRSGILHLHLSTRTKVKRKLSTADVASLLRVNGCHPLTLTVEAETRKLLADLIECGFYTATPEAVAAIRSALAEARSVATPIMPVTDFELVAYADESESLLCIACPDGADGRPVGAFTPGKRYPLTTATYTFEEHFSRRRSHLNEDTGRMFQMTHNCSLNGQDRYIAVEDDEGEWHRFMDRPQDGVGFQTHGEVDLWRVFERPVVRTVAEVFPEAYAANRQKLLAIQARIGEHLKAA